MRLTLSGDTDREARPRRGQVLTEFAIIAFVVMLILAGILTFGLLLHGANVIQQAADVGAMEFSRHPASPMATFTEALEDSGLFREDYLVCFIGGPNTSAEDLPANYTPADVTALQTRMPLINRLLFSSYIYDRDIGAIRYPGAVVTRNSDSIETVRIPLVTSRDPVTGVETGIVWRGVVEEIIPIGEMEGPYSLTATAGERGALDAGMVALRINYPYQSGAMIAWQYRDKTTNDSVTVEDVLGADVDVNNFEVEATDAGVLDPPGYTLFIPSDSGLGPNAGRGGLGRLYAMGKTVRPFRRTLTAQAIYRREVFTP